MLIITRRVGEEILIDKGTIQIKVLQKRRGGIAFGIIAPKGIDVERKEIFLKKLLNPIGQRKPEHTTSVPTISEESLL